MLTPNDTGCATLCCLPGWTIPTLLPATAALTGTNPGEGPTVRAQGALEGTSLPKPSQVPTQDIATIAVSDPAGCVGRGRQAGAGPRQRWALLQGLVHSAPPALVSTGATEPGEQWGAADSAHVPWMGWVPVLG